MSKTLEKIREDFLDARKMRRSVKAAFLGTIIAEAEQKATFNAATKRKDVTEENMVKILKSFEKKTLEFINIVSSPKANEELFIIQSYLPQQFDENQIYDLLKTSDTPKTKKDLMKFLKDNYAGQYDGKTASIVVDKIVSEAA